MGVLEFQSKLLIIDKQLLNPGTNGKGTTSQPAKKLRFQQVFGKGTTSVVPSSRRKNSGFSR
jgi:hypothetical protein